MSAGRLCCMCLDTGASYHRPQGDPASVECMVQVITQEKSKSRFE